MKFLFTTFNKSHSGKIQDGWVRDNLMNGLKDFCVLSNSLTESEIESADAIFVIRLWESDFIFDFEQFNRCKHKPFIVFDYAEYGPIAMFSDWYLNKWDLIGIQIDVEFNSLWKPEHHAFFKAMTDANIVCYFKRELSVNIPEYHGKTKILPIDYFHHHIPSVNVVSEEEFYKRPIDLFFNWGFSNPDRSILHGKLMSEITKFGDFTFTSVAQYSHYTTHCGATNSLLLVRSDPWERINFFEIQPFAKTCVDLYGAGIKCFRNWESAMNSMSFKQDVSSLKYAFPWKDGENCVCLPNFKHRLDATKSCDIIYHMLRGNGRERLYPIYKESCSYVKKYDSTYYLANHILPNIESVLKS